MGRSKRDPKAEAWRALPVPDGFEAVHLVREDGPVLLFHGRVIGRVDTNPRGDRRHWIELTIWETPSGGVVAAATKCSGDLGEVNLTTAIAITDKSLGIVARECASLADWRPARLMVMDFYGWSPLARSLTRKMGWEEFVEIVE